MARSRLAVLFLAPLAIGLTACGGGDDDPGGLPAVTLPTVTQSSTSPSASATPSATPTVSSPAAVPTRAQATYRDLTVDLLRPATLDASAGAAVTRFHELNNAFGALAAAQPAPPALSQFADPAVVNYLNEVLKPQQARRERSGGIMTIRVTKAQAQGSLAAVVACMDQTS